MLKHKREEIINHVKANATFLKTNTESLDIYDGNLLPYVDAILKKTLSTNYYNSIKERVIPINILPKYINKVSTTYSKPPQRTCANEAHVEFLEYYEDAFEINNEGFLADSYSNLFKGFAWEPYINKDGEPSLRTLPYDRFLVMSDSQVSPEEETIFIKIMGQKGNTEDSILLHVYTDKEFDAFYMNGEEASEYLIENNGENLYGCIPFVYGKRQKNKLVPTLDTDMLAITKAISVMLTDAAGAQMFQCFSILYGIDLDMENISISPNALWSFKSDKDSDKKPEVGTIKPEADTQKVLDFVANIFVLWLETKGIRVSSVGNMSGGSFSSGISKIIDEMDVFEIRKKSMEWFEQDEEELWNDKLPKIHNHWLMSGQLNPAMAPKLIANTADVDIEVEFERPTPMLTRAEQLANVKSELDLGIITKEMAIKMLYPEFDDEKVMEIVKDGESLVDSMKKENSDEYIANNRA